MSVGAEEVAHDDERSGIDTFEDLGCFARGVAGVDGDDDATCQCTPRAAISQWYVLGDQIATRAPTSTPRATSADAKSRTCSCNCAKVSRVSPSTIASRSGQVSAEWTRAAGVVLGCVFTELPTYNCLVGYRTDVQESESLENTEYAATVRTWLEENLTGEFAALRGKGGPGSEHEFFEQRLAWDRHLAEAGWTCIGWPTEHGGRGASMEERVTFHTEYAKADAPARVNHLGEELLGPTLIAFGTEEQKKRFLPGIRNVTELWAQVTPSRAPDPTSPMSRPPRGSKTASGSSTVRRCGHPSRTSRSGRS